ncbi:oxygen-independent coproporphyrinogen III oxidase [Helicobacter sp. 13S00401-1]|uniref:oxygen-independent coproporphyrinogen III oxidase n=1 Tax=Helicobacter sp. 13S00401-1 TaxID=1905758 RepID=UPI000BA74F8E|nr:oxygen-independent coproporphyrinogen III oxidase [Helicobacter sp. 13S00401-1]PAF50075.1 oxygen-independent coproporphyrinogen III oxidase [Helicobacter sp. 13S00401-1]
MSKSLDKIDFSKLATHSKPGPRYTSYPTANEFNASFNASTLEDCLKRSDLAKPTLPLSIYVHLPFCKSACYFCGCNVIYTSKEDKKDRYISYLKKELDLLKPKLDTSREVVQFHFGGGTPTFFNADQLKEVIDLIKGTFTNFSSKAEISCEIDPRHFDEKQMRVLKEGGFNRISFGVQDFDSAVQTAVNRIQSLELVKDSMNLARKYGINSINFDLIYGLPFQSLRSFQETLQKVLSLSPDRLAIFNYAHVPWVKKSMRKIDESALPLPSVKLEILKECINLLENSGYEMIGMDHFAKKSDELYLAKEKGELRRNFQGYTTKGFSQTIGIGITSIGEGADYYTQNYKDMKSYEEAIDKGVLPVSIGILLSEEDMLRKAVIMSLMNNLVVDFEVVNKEFGIDFKSHFASELKALEDYEKDDLLKIEDSKIVVSPTGGFLIRNIAMVFDTFLVKNIERKFSKTI